MKAARRAASETSLNAATAKLLASPAPLEALITPLLVVLGGALEADAAVMALTTGSDRKLHRNGVDPVAAARAEQLIAELERGARSIVSDKGICFPLQFGSEQLGAIAISSLSGAFSELTATLLETWSMYVSVRLHFAQLAADKQRLETIASSDQLTGLANRRVFDERLDLEWKRAGLLGLPLSIIIIDVDFFKTYNDRYGHLAGDAALRRVAGALHDCIHRPADVLARFGGEEFAALLPETEESGAIPIAEAMRSAVKELQIEHEGSEGGVITASFGVSGGIPLAGALPSSIIGAADRHLYEAKARGRNRVVASDYRTQTPAVDRRNIGTHNVPSPATSFVGRSKELAKLWDAIARSRLVTVAGPAGSGKTRLITTLALRSSAEFPDGIWFVDLRGATSPDEMLRRITSALEVPQSAPATFAEAVLERLKEHRALLILDACEDVCADLGTFVDEVLRETLQARIVSTTRQVLAISGETVVRIEGMATSEAVNLLVERAAQASREDPAALADFCEHLDNLPLAIELAAAQLKSRSFDALQADVASGALATNTLGDVIAWSFRQLAEPARRLLVDLSIFAPGFTQAAALEVCDAKANDFETLVRRSLVIEESQSVPQRYRLLEITASYARRMLVSQRQQELMQRHLLYYLQHDNTAPDDELEADTHNLRVAMQNAQDSGARTEFARLANMLVRFWLRRGLLSEARAWLQAVIDAPGTVDEMQLAQALRHAGMVSRRMADYEAARKYNERALAIYRVHNEDVGVSNTLNGLALLAHTTGDFDRAQELYQEALQMHEAAADDLGAAMTINNLGGLALYRRDYHTAEQHYMEAIERARTLDEPGLEAMATANLAELRYLQGRYEEAQTLAQRSLHSRLERKERAGIAESWLKLAIATILSGSGADAWKPLRESLLLFYDIGNRAGVAEAILATATLLHSRGQAEAAARMLGSFDGTLNRLGVTPLGAQAVLKERLLQALETDLGSRRAQEFVRDGSAMSFNAAFEAALGTFR